MSDQPESISSPSRDRLHLALLSDRALTPEQWSDDAFGLENRLGAVKDAILLKETQTPLSIMITGRWGTGKTSAMAWLDGALTERETKIPQNQYVEVDTCWFHPWKYQNQEEVWRGLIAEVILCICDRRDLDWNTVKQITGETASFLGSQVLNFLAAAKLRFGDPKGASAEMAFEKPIAQLRAEADALFHPQNAHLNLFESTLKKWVGNYYPDKKRRLVIFIDDLDRCMPGVALQVLEALKLYLNIPNLVIVAGVDRGILDEIIQKSYSDLVVETSRTDDFKEKSLQYLDKMFQVEINIEPDEKQITKFFEEKIVASEAWKSIDKEDAKQFRLVILSLCKRVPRTAVRLANKVVLAWGRWTGESELSLSQALQVELIEVVAETEQKGLGGIQKDEDGQRFLYQWSRIITSKSNPIHRIPKSERLRRLRLIQQEEVDEARHSDKGRPDLKDLYGPAKEGGEKINPKFDHLAPLLHPNFLPYEVLLGNLSMARLLTIPYPQKEHSNWPLFDPKPSQAEIEFLIRWLAEIHGVDPEDLDPDELLNSSELDISGSGVGAINPIRWLTQLTYLDVRGADYSDLSSLSNLSRLTTLRCSNTNVDSLFPLRRLSSLKRLECDSTQISDLSPLNHLTNLENFSLGGTKVSDLSPLSGLTSLKILGCYDTDVTDLSPLNDLMNLQELYCWGTKVSDLSSLSGLVNLQKLYISGTKVSDLSPLSGLVNLQKLYISGTKVSDLSPLSGLTSLKILGCYDTDVTDLSPLNDLMNLQKLYCWSTKVSDLSPLGGLTSLQVLHCQNTKVTKEEVDKLQKALPNCKIISDFN